MGRLEIQGAFGNVQEYDHPSPSFTDIGWFTKLNLRALLEGASLTFAGNPCFVRLTNFQDFNSRLRAGVIKISATEYRMHLFDNVNSSPRFADIYGPTWLIADLPVGDSVLAVQLYQGSSAASFAVAEPDGAVIEEYAFTMPVALSFVASQDWRVSAVPQILNTSYVSISTASFSNLATPASLDAAWKFTVARAGTNIGARPSPATTGLISLYEFPEIGQYDATINSVVAYPGSGGLASAEIIGGGEWEYVGTPRGRLRMGVYGYAANYNDISGSTFSGLTEYGVIIRFNLKAVLEGATPTVTGVASNARWLLAFLGNGAELWFYKPNSTTYRIGYHIGTTKAVVSTPWDIADLPSGDVAVQWAIFGGTDNARFSVATPEGAVIEDEAFTSIDTPLSDEISYIELDGLPRRYTDGTPPSAAFDVRVDGITVDVSMDSLAILNAPRTGSAIGAKPEPDDADVVGLWYFFVDQGLATPSALTGDPSIFIDVNSVDQEFVGGGIWNAPAAVEPPPEELFPEDAFGFYIRLQYQPDGGYVPMYYTNRSLILWRVRANVPVGLTAHLAVMDTGTPTLLEPMSDMIGTGEPKDYVWRHQAGPTGPFDDTGYVYFTGGSTAVEQQVDVHLHSALDFNQATNILGPTLILNPDSYPTYYRIFVIWSGTLEYSIGTGPRLTAMSGANYVDFTRITTDQAVTFYARSEGSEISNSVIIPASLDAYAQAEIVMEPLGYTADLMQFRVTLYNPTGTLKEVRLPADGMTPGVAVLAPENNDTWYTSPHDFWVTRPEADGNGDGLVKAEGRIDGGPVADTDFLTVPPIGADVARVRVRLELDTFQPNLPDLVRIVARVEDDNPIAGTPYNFAIVAPRNVSATIVTPPGPGPVAEGGVVKYDVTIPAAGTENGRLTVRAFASGRQADQDAIDIPPKDRNTLATSLATVTLGTPMASASEVVIPFTYSSTSTAAFFRVYVRESTTMPELTSVELTGYPNDLPEIHRQGGTPPTSIFVPVMLAGNWVAVTVVPYDEFFRKGTTSTIRIETPVAGPALQPLGPVSAYNISAIGTDVLNGVVMPADFLGRIPTGIQCYVDGTPTAAIYRTLVTGETVEINHGADPGTYEYSYRLFNAYGLSTTSASTGPILVTGAGGATLATPTLVDASGPLPPNQFNHYIVVSATGVYPPGTLIEVERVDNNNGNAGTIVATNAPGTLTMVVQALALGSYNLLLRARAYAPGYTTSAWSSPDCLIVIPINEGGVEL